jgi:hypothetical protein
MGPKEKSIKGWSVGAGKGRKMSLPLGKLNFRQRKYVEGRARGNTKTKAAIDAGYARSVPRGNDITGAKPKNQQHPDRRFAMGVQEEQGM